MREPRPDTEQHFKFVLSGLPAVSPGEVDRELLQAIVMRRKYRIEALFPGLRRKHHFDEAAKVRFCVFSARVGDARIRSERSLHQPHPAARADFASHVIDCSPEVRLKRQGNRQALSSELVVQRYRRIDNRSILMSNMRQ